MKTEIAPLERWLADVMVGQVVTDPLRAGHEVQACLDLALQHEVVGLVNTRLQQADAANGGLLQAFEAAAHAETMKSMVQEREIGLLLKQAQRLGTPVLLLKGTALAYWAYEQPQMRACKDIDLLVPTREQAMDLTRAAQSACGWAVCQEMGYELQCTKAISPAVELELDVHWRLVNTPLFAEVFGFEELMQESRPIPALAANAFGLGLVHAFIHACLHRMANVASGTPDNLKWLFDVHVLQLRFTPQDWRELLAVCQAKQMAGLCLSGMQAAANCWGAVASPAFMQDLAGAQKTEELDMARMADWRYAQSMSFQSLTTWGQKWHWLRERVFANRSYLAAIYNKPQASYLTLLGIRVVRVLYRLVWARWRKA
jgi:Uncharacterised nucleotidyltransferase